MKKQLTAGRVIRYLLYLCIASTLIFGVTYARYIQEIQGQGTVSTAAVAMDSQLDLTQKLQGMYPGETRTVELAVTNQKGSIVSEIAQEYSITISTTDNLPLTYSLAPKDTGGTGTYATNSGGGLTWTGGLMPYSETGVTHTYTLTVTWPTEENSTRYMNEVDVVSLTVNAKQVLPTEN